MIAALTAPVMLGWAGLSFALGGMQEKRAKAQAESKSF
jgi:hypothetical protein